MRFTRMPVGLLLFVLLWAGTGCGAVDDFRKSRHMKRAEAYAAQKKWKEATIEYRNVLRFDQGNLDLVRKLGTAYFEAGQLGEAFPLLRRYHEGHPDDPEVCTRMGMIYLLGRAPELAREQALHVLEKSPRDLDALTLLAETTENDGQVHDVIARLEPQRAALGQPERVSRLLGSLYLRKRDLARAEQEYQVAVAARPGAPESHVGLGRLYATKGELVKAEQEYRTAAGLSSAGSYVRLQLVDFLIATRRTEDARRELEAITREAPDASAAWVRLADLALADHKADAALKALEPALKLNADNVTALLVKARIHLAKFETDQAIETARRVTTLYPGYPQGFYHLALAQAQKANTAGARLAAEQSVRLAPAYSDAVLLLSRLQLQGGDPRLAVASLQGYLQLQPGDARAWDQLCTTELRLFSELRTGRPEPALEAARKVAALAPQSPRGPFLTGLVLRQAGRPGEARRAFEQALALAPSHADALAQLASLEFAERRSAAAVELVRRQASLQPQSAELQLMLARAYHASRDLAKAEAAYLKAVELDPNLAAGYVSLGQIYARSRQFDRATANLEKALAARPDEPGALMLWSVVQEMKGDQAKARTGYERLVEKNPRFAPANNNLAWMLAEEGNDLARAFALAQAAREAAPNDASVADTLGWIFYKQKSYPAALALFEEAAEKLPGSAEVRYHLGLAQAAVGRKKEARASLQRALASGEGQTWAAGARRALGGL